MPHSVVSGLTVQQACAALQANRVEALSFMVRTIHLPGSGYTQHLTIAVQNEDMGDTQVRELAQALKENSSLTFLDLQVRGSGKYAAPGGLTPL